MESLSSRRCSHHPDRHAVARCPECAHFYCRECIAEHEDRVLCAGCLKRLTKPHEPSRFGFWAWAMLAQTFQFTLGLFIVWSFFYFSGKALVAIPVKFHDGTVWHLNHDEGDDE